MALDENAYTIKGLEYDEIVKKILEISTLKASEEL